MDQVFDVAIIGGGINGCGCAADAAQRGLSVVLFEKDDLASKTSSSSTKLIHGGLRYLEYYQFALVKKALEERHTLLQIAPHIVQGQPFIVPQQNHMRPNWLVRLGLFFYDHLSRQNNLPKCKSIQRSTQNNYFNPLINACKRGFLFYDAITDDARLTIINALQAKNHGASIRPHSQVTQAKIIDNKWQLHIQPKQGEAYTVRAKVLINASGPWVESVEKMTKTVSNQPMALIKGSHIVVPQMYEGKQAYFLQNDDKRIIFVIPYHGYSMIGTTEQAFTGCLDQVRISEEEINYLVQLANSYFKIQIQPKDIVYTWSGVRPLLAQTGSQFTSFSRDYKFLFENTPAPLITIYGGKITTYRQLSEEIINQLTAVFPNMRPCTTKPTPLPGACLDAMSFTDYIVYATSKYHWLGKELLTHYLHTYGTCMESFLAPCSNFTSLGTHFGNKLYQVEVDYLVKHEWAETADDILTRRTKLVLGMDAKGRKLLEEYLHKIAAKAHCWA